MSKNKDPYSYPPYRKTKELKPYHLDPSDFYKTEEKKDD